MTAGEHSRRPRRNGLAVGVLAVAVLAGSASGAPSPALATPGDVYAIVVGYNGGRPGLPALHFADDDAVRLSLLLGGLAAPTQANHIVLLTDFDADTQRGIARAGLRSVPAASPTRTALFAAFHDIATALAARPGGAGPPTFYFIYAGHGLHGRILLKPEQATDAAITGHELRAAVAELVQSAPMLRSFIFLDACRSQSLFTERGAATAPDAEIGPDLSAEVATLEQRTRVVTIGVLTAAFSGRPAGEVRSLGAGYFSHVLASGLAGAADADGDELVSFAELAAFVAYNTERLTAQRPWFSPPGGDFSTTAVDLRAARTRLELTGSPSGRYLIEASSGRPIFAEAVKGDRRALRLSLPAGRYRVLRAAGADGQPAQSTDVELMAGMPVDLSRAIWSDATPTSIVPPPTLARGDSAAAEANRNGSEGDEPAAPVFSSAFTSEAVSTLTAAYHAGREPPSGGVGTRNAVGISATLGQAPAAVGGVELGAALRYRRRFRGLSAGASAAFGSSSHAAITTYRLERWTVLAEAGPRWTILEGGLELAVSLAAGGGPVVRRGSDGAISGDAFAPVLGLNAVATVRLADRWSLVLDLRAAVQWVSVDGSRARATGLAGQSGIEWAF